MSHPRTHRTRLARLLARHTGTGYQHALTQVDAAAQAGRLPARLDDAGIAAALRILTADTDADTEANRYPDWPDRDETLNLLAHRADRIAGSWIDPEGSTAAAAALTAEVGHIRTHHLTKTDAITHLLTAAESERQTPERAATWQTVWNVLISAAHDLDHPDDDETTVDHLREWLHQQPHPE